MLPTLCFCKIKMVFGSCPSTVIPIQRLSFPRWCVRPFPALCPWQESPIVAVIPRQTAITTLVSEGFTKWRTATVEKMTKVHLFFVFVLTEICCVETVFIYRLIFKPAAHIKISYFLRKLFSTKSLFCLTVRNVLIRFFGSDSFDFLCRYWVPIQYLNNT